MLNNTRQFNSYKSLFKIQFKIYDIGGKVLPRPIPLEALAMTAILYFPMLPIICILEPAHPWATTVAISGACSWVMSQLDLQGKFMPLFFKDMLSFLLRPKTTNLMGQKINRLRRYKLEWRLPEVD